MPAATDPLRSRDLALQGAMAGALVGCAIAAFALASRLAAQPDGASAWRLLSVPAVLAVVGAILPLVAARIVVGMRTLLTPLGISRTSLDLPLLGKVELELGNPQRAAARRIFFEMATRTVTQPLATDDGTIRAAIDSMYGFFGIVRDELKSMPPTPTGTRADARTLEFLGAHLLNAVVRPYLSRWHPRLDAWEGAGFGESDWPLAEMCREDLVRMRALGTRYAYQLAHAIQVQSPAELLPPLPAEPPNGAALPESTRALFESLDAWADGALGPPERHLAHAVATDLRLAAGSLRRQAEDPPATAVQRLSTRIARRLCAVDPMNGDGRVLAAGRDLLRALSMPRDLPDTCDELATWCDGRATDFDALLQIARPST